MNNRVACICIVDFPLIVLVQDRDAMSLYPYAIAEHEQPNAVLVAVNYVAERDVKVGMTVAQAHNRCAQLRVLVRDTLQEQCASAKIQELLHCVGPHIEPAGAGEYYLELRGLTRLHGGEDGIARNVLRQFATTPYTVQIGIASNKPVARIASRRTARNSTLIVPGGSERNFLIPLPIIALGMAPVINSQLYALGLKMIGDITRLPMQEITRRFGEDVRCLADCMRSDNVSLVTPVIFPHNHSAEVRFDDGLDTVEQLVQNIFRLLQAVLTPLKSSGRGCREIAIQFAGAHYKPKVIQVKLNHLTVSLSAWKRQIQHSLADEACAFGVTTIRVTLSNIGVLQAGQLALFSKAVDHGIPAHSKTAEVEKLPLKRVALQQKVLPERGWSHSTWSDLESSVTTPSYKTPPCFYAGCSLAGLRLFQRPQGVSVTMHNDQVCCIVSRMGVERVIRQCAPYNVSGGWWEDEFWRAYYEVETDRGKTYLLFRDNLLSKWYLHGFFD